MIKKIVTASLLLLVSVYSFSQSSIRASLGYGLPMNSDLIMTQVREGVDDNSNFYRNVKGIYGTFGSGFRLNAAFTRRFAKNNSFAWDIENTFVLGKKHIDRSEYQVSGTVTQPERTENRSLSYQITPSIAYYFKWKNFAPYIRIGPSIGITKITTDVSILNPNLLRIEYSYEYKGGLSFGYKTAIGASVQISPNGYFFGELSLVNMTYAPKEGWLTRYDVEGASELDQFTSDERRIKFEKEYTLSPDDQSEITISTRNKYSMGAFCLNLGVTFKL